MTVSVPMLTAHPSRKSMVRRAVTLLRRKKLGSFAGFVLVLLVTVAVLAPWITPYDRFAVHLGKRLAAPSSTYWFGTDSTARDLFTRVLYGMRLSITVAAIATLAGTCIGTAVGVLTGYLGGLVDLLVQRMIDVLQAVPSLMLAMVTVALLGASVVLTVCVIGVLLIPSTARVVRSATLVVQHQPYVEAASIVGCHPARIMMRHVLPNVLPPIIVVATLSLAIAILIESSLSFLGLGIPPPEPSLGGMLSFDGRTFMEQRPTLAIFPGLALSLLVLSFNLVGDSLRDILDPRLRGTE